MSTWKYEYSGRTTEPAGTAGAAVASDTAGTACTAGAAGAVYAAGTAGTACAAGAADVLSVTERKTIEVLRGLNDEGQEAAFAMISALARREVFRRARRV